MLNPLEGESLRFDVTGGMAGKQRLANCSGAEQLVWRDAKPGDRLTVHFTVPRAGRYSAELNLCMSPNFGRQKLSINGKAAEQVLDEYSPQLYFLHPQLGVFELRDGEPHSTRVSEF